MNVLCDRHHAGLLYSLQLLFEDRLGGTVWVPVGHDWWDEGFWQFGAVFGDDRLARQYLEPNPPWRTADPSGFGLAEGFWLTEDVEFPSRIIRGISLKRAREMEWAYTVASVQENQPGFARIAKETGAKAVYQVGNNNQRIDWSLDPLVLASAKIEMEGRGVTYHQEFSKDETFRFAPPEAGSPTVIRSFVNCFNVIPDEFRRYGRFQQLLPEFLFFTHGHDGADGLVQPTETVAAVMAASGWGYHDKPQGDGFGHIIHYWAATGRPLIGSARYYEGLFAEHLWEDLVTCVDLSRRSNADAAYIVRSLAADPVRYGAMCHAIRDRLDTLVDFDREEREIRALLGA